MNHKLNPYSFTALDTWKSKGAYENASEINPPRVTAALHK